MMEIKATVTSDGKLEIPEESLHALGLSTGDEVTLWLDEKKLRASRVDRAIKRAQELVRPYLPPERLLADELIAERRREAQSED